MKFVKKIGEGEVKIEDNQVKGADGKPIEATADDWTEEFSKEQVSELIDRKCAEVWFMVTNIIVNLIPL